MKKFKCKHCEHVRDVSFWKELFSFHLFGIKVYVKCLNCGKRSWMKKVEDSKIVDMANDENVKQYIVEQLQIYDNSHPKLDEIKFVRDIQKELNLTREEVFQLIQKVRREMK